MTQDLRDLKGHRGRKGIKGILDHKVYEGYVEKLGLKVLRDLREILA